MSYIEYVNASPHGEEIAAKLAAALGYHISDLFDNRKGKLSASQKQHLTMGEIASPMVYAALSLMGTLAVRFIYLNYARGMSLRDSFEATIGNLLMLRFSVAMEHLLDHDGPSGTGFTLASFAVISIAVFKLLKMPWTIFFDILGGRVRRVSGRVDVRLEERTIKVERGKKEQIPVHFFAVKEFKFEVPKAAVESLMEGEQYHLYYLPKSKLLIGMEAKSGAEEVPAAEGPQPGPAQTDQTPAVQ